MTRSLLDSVLAYLCMYICLVFYLANADMFWPVNITDWKNCDKSDNAFRTLYGISVESCVEECNLRTSCKAVNYIRKSQQCELLRTDLHTDIDKDKRACVYIKKNDTNSAEVVQKCDNCQERQTCVLPEGDCVYKECEKLNVSHGVVKGNMVNVGATVKVVLDACYTLGSQSPKSVCTSNGTWDNTPVPELVECGKFNVSHGVVHGNMSTGRATVEVVPDTGYTLGSQSNTSECQCNGTWDNIPVLELVHCGTPRTVANSVIRDGSTTYGSNRKYSCNNGYDLVGASSDMIVTCNADGTWSETSFWCEVNRCGEGWSYFKADPNTERCYKGTVAKANSETKEDYCSRVNGMDVQTWNHYRKNETEFCRGLSDNLVAPVESRKNKDVNMEGLQRETKFHGGSNTFRTDNKLPCPIE